MMHELVCCRAEAANHLLSIAVAFWIIPIVSTEECSSLMQSWMHISCSIRSVILNVTATHVHMLTQRHLLPPLTSTVKSSLFTLAFSSPLSMAGMLHWCCPNHSPYINNGWTFSAQNMYIHILSPLIFPQS